MLEQDSKSGNIYVVRQTAMVDLLLLYLLQSCLKPLLNPLKYSITGLLFGLFVEYM